MHDSSLMQLMWLASPALPIGGFSYSEGLEAAVDTGRVTCEADATSWLLDQLQLSLARADLHAVAQAIAAWREADHLRIAELNAWVLQTRESSELRAQSEQMGRSLLEWLRNHTTAQPRQIDVLAALQPTYPPRVCTGGLCHPGASAGLSAGLCFWLGREHGAGGHQVGAAGPERRATHFVGTDRPDSCRRGYRADPRRRTTSGFFAHAGHSERPA